MESGFRAWRMGTQNAKEQKELQRLLDESIARFHGDETCCRVNVETLATNLNRTRSQALLKHLFSVWQITKHHSQELKTGLKAIASELEVKKTSLAMNIIDRWKASVLQCNLRLSIAVWKQSAEFDLLKTRGDSELKALKTRLNKKIGVMLEREASLRLERQNIEMLRDCITLWDSGIERKQKNAKNLGERGKLS